MSRKPPKKSPESKPKAKGKPAPSKNEILLAALAAGKTRAEAAKAAGVSVRLVYQRLEDPDFAARLTAMRREVVDQVVGQLTTGATEAVQTLRNLLGPKQPPFAQLGAAQAIIGRLMSLSEFAEIERRIAALETQARAKSDAGTTRPSVLKIK